MRGTCWPSRRRCGRPRCWTMRSCGRGGWRRCSLRSTPPSTTTQVGLHDGDRQHDLLSVCACSSSGVARCHHRPAGSRRARWRLLCPQPGAAACEGGGDANGRASSLHLLSRSGCAGWAMEEEVAQVGQQLRCFEVCVLMCSSSTPAMRRAGKGMSTLACRAGPGPEWTHR